MDGQSQGTGEIQFKPGQLFRYDLQPGQSYLSRFSIRSRTKTPDGTLKDNTKYKVRTRYIGRETVRVPAGKFKACKFKSTTTVNQLGFEFTNERTFWQATKTGVEVKTMDENGMNELVSATLNGKKL